MDSDDLYMIMSTAAICFWCGLMLGQILAERRNKARTKKDQ